MGPSTRTFLRRTALTTLKAAGVFHLVKNSPWRRQRLLILCYHGIAQEDENEWRPYLYISSQTLERRLEILRKGGYTVLPLDEAVQRLFQKDLPPRSLVLTFDDGTYDFYKLGYPLVKKFGFPVTVYLTTYYSDHQRPIFVLMCSYLLWKARHLGTVKLDEFGIKDLVDLRSETARQAAEKLLAQWVDSLDITGDQKDQIAGRLAQRLGIDYQDLCRKRILHLMKEEEVNQLAREGVDFQLHTHRHRTPRNEELFLKEIRENRARIVSVTGRPAQHFCYPSGAYRPEFLPWLEQEGVVSATTCDTGIAHSRNNPLLLHRLVDTSGRSELEFEGWTSGVSQFISSRRLAPLAYRAD
jgi:peptidoglycan/xylan/chitin deacetylase (PgdA/CDA1 family)